MKGVKDVRLSAAKALVRQYFYLEFLPTQLPMQLIQAGNYLVLFGDSLAEVELLRELGVPGRNVHSVENKLPILERQLAQIKRGELQAAMLYYGELSAFIRSYLYTNQRFQVLNLDICGSYLHHIDPVMTPVLLFARRNPNTVIATYTNVGRDRLQLSEGLKSLALFLWLTPEVAARVSEVLFARYRSCGMRPLTAFTMVLRHMFWIRSHLEHTLTGQVMIGPTRTTAARKIFEYFESTWQSIRSQLKRGFTYSDLVRSVAKQSPARQLPTVLDLNIQQVAVATYAAIDIAYHTAWFCTYQRVHLMEPVEWTEQALLSLIAQPLRFASSAATELESIETARLPIPPGLVLWGKIQLAQCRKLALPQRSRQFAALRSTAPVVTAAPVPAILQPQEVREDRGESMPKKAVQRAQRNAAKKTSPTETVRLLARQGYKTDDIAQMVPEVSRASIRAYIAHASRAKGKK